MGAAKRLRNDAGLRGTPTAAQGGMTPSNKKRGLRGTDLGLWAETTPAINPHSRTAAGQVPTVQTGQDNPDTGDVGVGVDGADLTLVARGSQYAYAGDPKVSGIPDNRAVLDSDSAPLGTDVENAVLATFTAATGAGASDTFTVTGANTGKQMRVEAWARGTDNDEDDFLLGVFYDTADGTAKTFTIVDPGPGYATGDTIAVYVRELDDANNDPGTADGISAGHQFATRRTVATHA